MYFKISSLLFLFLILNGASARKHRDKSDSSSSSSEEDDSHSQEKSISTRGRSMMCAGQPFNLLLFKEMDSKIEECLENKLDETIEAFKNSRRKSTRRLANNERKLKKMLNREVVMKRNKCSSECKWQAFGLISNDMGEGGTEEFSKLFPEGAQEAVKTGVETCLKVPATPKRRNSRMRGMCQDKKKLEDCFERAVIQGCKSKPSGRRQEKMPTSTKPITTTTKMPGDGSSCIPCSGNNNPKPTATPPTSPSSSTVKTTTIQVEDEEDDDADGGEDYDDKGQKENKPCSRSTPIKSSSTTTSTSPTAASTTTTKMTSPTSTTTPSSTTTTSTTPSSTTTTSATTPSSTTTSSSSTTTTTELPTTVSSTKSTPVSDPPARLKAEGVKG